MFLKIILNVAIGFQRSICRRVQFLTLKLNVELDNLSFEVPTAVLLKMKVFRDVTQFVW